MAAEPEDQVPPIPTPPAAVPPVEPQPAAAQPAAAPAAAAPPATPYGAPATPYAPPGYQQPQQYQPYPQYQPGPPQGLAITSMVCGIGGLVLLFFGIGSFASVAAVITGHLAQKRQSYAKGFWITGLITGYAGVALGLLFLLFLVIFIVAIPFMVVSNSYY